jgi:hypothetical protein
MPKDRRPPHRPTAHQRRQRRRESAARAARNGFAAAADQHPVGGGAVHQRLATVSRPVLLRLHTLPGWVVPLVTLALLLGGLFFGGVIGFACLLLVAAFLGWLLAVSWPAISTGGRLLRLAAVAAVAAAAGFKLL